MSSTESPPESQEAPSPENKTHGSKRHVTRVRTGCSTCRKRRKKCDEGKPQCQNCLRNNWHCGGYPDRVQWETHRSAARDGRRPQKTSHRPKERLKLERNNQNLKLVEDESQKEGHACCPCRRAESAPKRIEGTTTRLLGWTQNEGQETGIVPFNDTEGWASKVPYQLPLELPFLIPGVDSPVHRQFFCHFTGVMSHFLTMADDESNPFNSVVIPLALADETVMDSLLCLAGSHILQLQHTLPSTELKTEYKRLHSKVLKQQTQRIESLLSTTSSEAPHPTQNHDGILATSLLLCLIEITAGTGDQACTTHLSMAREVITSSFHHPPIPTLLPDQTPIPHAPPLPTTTVNPFLLEFFLYHDSLATVTNPSTTPSHYPLQLTQITPKSPTLVGPIDGFLTFTKRIASLYNEKPSIPPSTFLARALQIWTDLSSWTPPPHLPPSRALLSKYYQHALNIWLFSLINPELKTHHSIQSLISEMIIGMQTIKGGEMACLLFPVFMVGMCCVEEGDRKGVREIFGRLGAWSGLGNIGLAWGVVERSWGVWDRGEVGSWDWVALSRGMGVSFLVT